MQKTNPDYPPVVLADSVEHRQVTIWSNGVALDGDLFRPKALTGDALAPAVVLAHGWGGDKGTTERYAAHFAERLGVVAVGFSFATWGQSGGQLLAQGSEAQEVGRSAEVVDAPVLAAREVVDPLDWLQNFRSVIDFVEGEPNVDGSRIGAWGTSFGAGIALHSAANDPRIKALCVQVAAIFQPPDRMQGPARQQAIAIARGQQDPIPQGGGSGRLDGTPHYARMIQYNAMAQVPRLRVPTLLVDVGEESMFDIAENAGQVFAQLTAAGHVPVRYEVLPGLDHYDIYFEGFERGCALATDWLGEHL